MRQRKQSSTSESMQPASETNPRHFKLSEYLVAELQTHLSAGDLLRPREGETYDDGGPLSPRGSATSGGLFERIKAWLDVVAAMYSYLMVQLSEHR